MARLSLVDRMKSWFGTARRERQHRIGVPAQHAGLALAAVGCNAGEGAADGPKAGAALADPFPVSTRNGLSAAEAPCAPPRETPSGSPERDAPDGEWVRALEALPERIAESVAAGATGAKTLEKIGRELDGHRNTSRAVAEAIGRLPDLTGDQAALTRRTHEILEQQTHLAEAMVDGLAGLRAALKTVEESADRHLACIGQLEQCHRRVLEVYQSMLLKAHRRLGHVATAALLLAAIALGAAGYVVYLAIVQ